MSRAEAVTMSQCGSQSGFARLWTSRRIRSGTKRNFAQTWRRKSFAWWPAARCRLAPTPRCLAPCMDHISSPAGSVLGGKRAVRAAVHRAITPSAPASSALGRLRPPVQLGGQVRQLRGGAFEPRLEARLNAICMMRVSSEYLAVNRERDSDFWASHR